MNDYDYCERCHGIFDYLDLRPYELKWYCKNCYKEITSKDAPVIENHKKLKS